MTVRPFFFTDIRPSVNVISFVGAFSDTRQSFEARVAHVSNFPEMIRVQQGCVVLPCEDRFYVVEVHMYPQTNRDRRLSIDYTEYIPPVVYQVMCGLIATIL
jgi:hypothetical protein